MAELKSRIERKLQEPAAAAAWQAATGGSPAECPPIYSFDNPSIHSGATHLAELGLTSEGKPTAAWLELPTYSGDLHRTIERVHARVCSAFQGWLDDASEPCTMLAYCNKLIELFRTQTPTQIEQCMWGKPENKKAKSLLDLYNKVISLGGDMAPRPYC